MIYQTADAWRTAPAKRVLFFGMSGLGKTHVSAMLRATGGWYHYSIDYRIGTRYMGEHIADSFKAEAMKVPYLADLLRSDSIYIASNITFQNLSPLSTYLGKPGDPAKGGLPWEEYRRRQALHRQAEVAALLDTPHFVDRAARLYGIDDFVCDASGSLCEVVDPTDPGDPVLTTLADTVLLVWIEGSEAHTQALIRRFDRDPKPMCYEETFLDSAWDAYRSETGTSETEVDPDAFVRWTYARALAHRQPRYRAIAERWGVTLPAEDIASVARPEDLTEAVARALEARSESA
ncbi:MAG: ATPase [Paracoccaceae bacterium]|nr:ATPase [Paracoccaceae bacterium]